MTSTAASWLCGGTGPHLYSLQCSPARTRVPVATDRVGWVGEVRVSNIGSPAEKLCGEFGSKAAQNVRLYSTTTVSDYFQGLWLLENLISLLLLKPSTYSRHCRSDPRFRIIGKKETSTRWQSLKERAIDHASVIGQRNSIVQLKNKTRISSWMEVALPQFKFLFRILHVIQSNVVFLVSVFAFMFVFVVQSRWGHAGETKCVKVQAQKGIRLTDNQ